MTTKTYTLAALIIADATNGADINEAVKTAAPDTLADEIATAAAYFVEQGDARPKEKGEGLTMPNDTNGGLAIARARMAVKRHHNLNPSVRIAGDGAVTVTLKPMKEPGEKPEKSADEKATELLKKLSALADEGSKVADDAIKAMEKGSKAAA